MRRFRLQAVTVFSLLALIALSNPAFARDPEEVSRLLSDPFLILLRNAEFDVRQGPPPAARNVPSIPANEARFWIVQLRGPATNGARAQLESKGADILSYIPNLAYLVRLDPESAAELDESPIVRWVGPYRPDWKFDPTIGTRTFTDPARPALPGELLLTLSVFEGEDPDAVASEALDRGADVLGVNRHPRTPRVLVRVTRGEERSLAAIGAVEWIEEVGEITMRNNATRWVGQSNVSNSTPVWDAGIHGEGQVIGHIDGGINRTSCYFQDLVDNNPGPGHRKIVGYRGTFASDSHGTHTAGTSAGLNSSGDLSNAGIAYGAKISHTKLSLISGFGNGVSNLYAYLDSASAQGANVHTNSWGDDGFTSYTTWCRDIDLFSRDREDDLVLFAVSNGPTVTTPENAKNCVGVGATRQAPSQEQHGSGGNGPTADGRRKPEIYLPGVGIISASTGSCGTASLSGTSMACPSVTGCAALIRQYYEQGYFPTGAATLGDEFDPSAALVKATLLNSGQDMTSVSGYPSNREGWGRTLLDDALFFAGDTRLAFAKDVRHVDGLATGQFDETTLTIGNGQTLRVTMAFTDQPAALGAAFTPINDLNLELEGPGGLYRGNVFSAGSSTTGGTADNRNNVERIVILSANVTPGEYTLRVRGASVPDGPQGFGIHVSGDVIAVDPATDVAPIRGAALAATFLEQNRPNPFTQSTTFRFAVGTRGTMTVSVFDIAGRRIRTLAEGSFDVGEYSTTWDARDDRGERVSAGIYFARLEGAGVDLTRKMVVLQ